MTYIPAMNGPFHSWCMSHDYKMKTNYIPANVPGQQNMNMERNHYIPAFCDMGRVQYGLSWWKDDCFYKYPFLLVSAAYGLEDPNFRETYQIDKDIFFLGDSGGYQVATQGVDIDPVRLLRWLEHNCDAGLILDVPPFDTQNSFQLGTPKDFDKALQKTKKNGDLMYQYQQDNTFQLYGVIQGETWSKLQTWHKTMIQDSSYDNWSIKPHPSNDVFKIIQAGIYAIEYLKGPLHLLQVSGINTMAVAAYISKYYKDMVTYDSSSYARGCISREYVLPFDFGTSLSFGNLKDNHHRLENLPCICPVCSKISAEELWQSGSMPGALIALHNLYWYILYSKSLNSLLEDKEMFMKFILKNCNDKTLKAIEFMDYYIDTKDAEKAVEKYKPYMTTQTKHEQRRFRI